MSMTLQEQFEESSMICEPYPQEEANQTALQLQFEESKIMDDAGADPDVYKQQIGFEEGFIENIDISTRKSPIVYDKDRKRLKFKWKINQNSASRLFVEVVDIENYKPELTKSWYSGKIENCEFRVVESVKGNNLLITTIKLAIKGSLVRIRHYLFSAETNEISNFLIKTYGIKFDKKLTVPISELKDVEVKVQLEKGFDEKYYQIHDLRKVKEK